MQLLKEQTNFNFMGKRKIAALFSLILIVIAIASLVTQSLNFGIDFTGGTMIEVAYQEETDLNQIRNTLEQAGFENAIVQNFGSIHDVLIRLPVIESENMAELSNQV
ncbi:MAG: protein translocase subunit SecF, partial [Gammaproteobacteria bacterium]